MAKAEGTAHRRHYRRDSRPPPRQLHVQLPGPNSLPAEKIQHIVQAVEPFAFERIYGGWWGRVIREDAKAAVIRSAERYLRAIGVKDDSANQSERTER